MEIKILGTGCPKCKQTAEIAKKAIKESGINAEIIKVTALNEIMNYNVMMTPAVVIDEEVKSSGKVPTKDEFIKWLQH